MVIEENIVVILDGIICVLAIEDKFKVVVSSDIGIERWSWEGYIGVVIIIFIFVSVEILVFFFEIFIDREESGIIGFEGKSVLNFWGFFLNLEKFIITLFSGEMLFIFNIVIDRVLVLFLDFTFFFMRFVDRTCWGDVRV